jgi:NADPH:quinone reductase-like Zn-dependent oxidoreductase
MPQTAYGAPTVGLDIQAGQALLIRGGTSSVGLTAAIVAERRGLTVLATTRSEAKAGALREAGCRTAWTPTLELVGTPTLRDSLEATRVHGVVCSAGCLSNEWIVPDLYPAGFLPDGVRLTGYFGEASDLPPAVLQESLDAVAAGEATVPIAKTYTMDEIATAHDDMEHDRVAGRLAVSTAR